MTRVFTAIVRVVLGCGLFLAVFGQMPVAAAVPVPPLTSPVIDTTGTLAAADIVLLERQALALQRSSGSQLQILMLSSTGSQSIEDYAQRVFEEWRLGRKDVDDGLLLLVAKDDRKVRIHTGTGLETVITDVTAARLIQEYLVPKFRRGDYAGGLGDATLVIASLMNGEPLPAPMAVQATETSLAIRAIALLIGLLAAIVMRVLAEYFDLRPLWRVSLVTTVCVAVTLLFGGGFWFALVAVVGGLLIGLIDPWASIVGTTGRRPVSWNPDALTYDPDAPEAVERRRQREREAAKSGDNGWFEGGGSGGGFGGGGWSGGGGSSRGGGASGGW